MIRQLSISGFRGFGIEQTIFFAIPDGEAKGSGLSIITGANNSGKTTILEAIRAFNSSESPSFSEGRRHIHANKAIQIKIIETNNTIDEEYIIKSIPGGGSSTEKQPDKRLNYYVLQSRRAFPFDFSRNEWDRNFYIQQSHRLNLQRNYSLNNFESRIFKMEKEKEEFNNLLYKILDDDFQWTIELRDSGQFYIKYTKGDISHSAEGIGDGIWSIFTICASLFDAEDGSTVVIDEPELSVHPTLQKRLMKLFLEYSKRIQIIICTHSPYFINWDAIANGAHLIRVAKEGTNSLCYSISNESRANIKKPLGDFHNPHVFGIDASEVFFLEDKIILVEGQEDVVYFNKIAKDLKKDIFGNFFGWGVGGAHKMNIFLQLFKDLGFKKVVAIYDRDKAKEAEQARIDYSQFSIITLKEDDIRDKEARSITPKTGITDSRGRLKEENKKYAIALIDTINNYFS